MTGVQTCALPICKHFNLHSAVSITILTDSWNMRISNCFSRQLVSPIFITVPCFKCLHWSLCMLAILCDFLNTYRRWNTEIVRSGRETWVQILALLLVINSFCALGMLSNFPELLLFVHIMGILISNI